MNNKEINQEAKLEIIEEMIVIWENEGTDVTDYILECATKIKDDKLIELAEKAMGFLAELESLKDEIDDIMWAYEEMLDEE